MQSSNDEFADEFAATFDPATAEHVLLETGADGPDPIETTQSSRRPTQAVGFVDRVRSTETRLQFYDDGVVQLTETRRGRPLKAHRLKLEYLDPAPSIERSYAPRAGGAAAGLGALAVIAAALAGFGVLTAVMIALAASAATAAAAATWLFFYRSRECIVFRTQHGRAPALLLTASLGAFGAQRALLPHIVNAIEDAGNAAIGDDTSVYLRLEMREHYRLRGDGVLSPQECADSTGRILAQFDATL